MRIQSSILRCLAALLIVVPAVISVTATQAQAAPPNVLPLNVTNNSGRSDTVYLYVVGVNLTTGKLGYVNAGGTFTPWPRGNVPPVPAPDVAIPGPGPGATRTLHVPIQLSGRVYMSFGAKIKFFLTHDGLVQPAPWAPADLNRDVLFDVSEFTYNSGGLWINTSMVDMFSVPHAVEVTGPNGAKKRTGQLVDDGRERIFNAIAGLPGDWKKLITRRGDGTRLRVLSPLKGVQLGLFSSTYFDSYVNQAWSTYKSRTLTVVPFDYEPGTKFFGHTDSSGVMRFTNTSGATVASFQKPSTKDVFGCDGALRAPNDLVVGPIARTLCAALHRSTLGFLHTQPTKDASQFYKRAVTDHYAKTMHAHSVDGKAYGFAFDDVGAFESLVHDGSPRSARITLTAF